MTIPAPHPLAWVPNALTVSRLLLAPAFPFLPEGAWGLASEFLDGFLARRWGGVSSFGKYLDPIADKLFVAFVLGTLWAQGITDGRELLAVGFRDVAIGLASLALLVKPEWRSRIAARPLGKATTALQFGFLVWLVVARDAPAWLVAATALLGAAAVVDYGLAWRRP